MKTKTIYQCEYCLSEYQTVKDAIRCEASCLKLTLDEYDDYVAMLNREKTASYIVSRTSDEETRNLYDKCIKDVIEFQQKHGITDSKW